MEGTIPTTMKEDCNTNIKYYDNINNKGFNHEVVPEFNIVTSEIAKISNQTLFIQLQ